MVPSDDAYTDAFELYAEDDSVIVIDHYARDKRRLCCTCGWKAQARGESEATNIGMKHVLEHDAALEDNPQFLHEGDEPHG